MSDSTLRPNWIIFFTKTSQFWIHMKVCILLCVISTFVIGTFISAFSSMYQNRVFFLNKKNPVQFKIKILTWISGAETKAFLGKTRIPLNGVPPKMIISLLRRYAHGTWGFCIIPVSQTPHLGMLLSAIIYPTKLVRSSIRRKNHRIMFVRLEYCRIGLNGQCLRQLLNGGKGVPTNISKRRCRSFINNNWMRMTFLCGSFENHSSLFRYSWKRSHDVVNKPHVISPYYDAPLNTINIIDSIDMKQTMMPYSHEYNAISTNWKQTQNTHSKLTPSSMNKYHEKRGWKSRFMCHVSVTNYEICNTQHIRCMCVCWALKTNCETTGIILSHTKEQDLVIISYIKRYLLNNRYLINFV